jgi:hypothetical protein
MIADQKLAGATASRQFEVKDLASPCLKCQPDELSAIRCLSGHVAGILRHQLRANAARQR